MVCELDKTCRDVYFLLCCLQPIFADCTKDVTGEMAVQKIQFLASSATVVLDVMPTNREEISYSTIMSRGEKR